MNERKITVSDIASAEKVLGIEYSKQEREQMINDLEDQIISAKTCRNRISVSYTHLTLPTIYAV